MNDTVAVNIKPVKKREDYWDVIRGLFILGVFVGHDIGGWSFITRENMVPAYTFLFNKWIFTRCIVNCVVPLFIFISGYMVNKKYLNKLAPFYMNRTVRFLVPFAVWSVIYSLLEVFVYHNKVTWMSVLLGTNGIQLYYLLVMMQLVFLTPVFFKVKNRKLVLIAALIINVLNNAYHVYYNYTYASKMPNEMILASCFIFYYFLGIYYRNEEMKILDKITFGRSVYILIIGFLIYVNSAYLSLNMINNSLVAVSFGNLGAFICASGAIIFAIKLREKLKDFDFGKYVVFRVLRWFGIHSMDFFLVHWVFENYIKVWFLDHVAPEYMFWSNTVIITATAVLCSIYAWIVDRVRGFFKSRMVKKAA